MDKLLAWFKRTFYLRIGQPPSQTAESEIVRFETSEDILVMTTENYEEVILPAGEYSLVRVENPYGQQEMWGLVVGTNLGAAVSCWTDWEERGLLKSLE